jgi:hypothetical protein
MLGDPQDIIGTKAGSMVTACGRPELDESSGINAHKDADGKKSGIRKDDVAEVKER